MRARPPHVLILSYADDVHVHAVRRRLDKLGVRCSVVDSAAMGTATEISYRIDGLADWKTPDTGLFLTDLTCVWYRRFYAPLLDEIVEPDWRHFAQWEWMHALRGMLRTLDARAVNAPEAELAATKLVQLAAARDVGMRVPHTLVTNSPSRALEFKNAFNGAIVHKAFTAPASRFLDTRRWDTAAEEALADLARCPTIFQEEIIGQADVRVTVIGDEMFAARTELRADGPVDSRLDLDTGWSAVALEPRTETLLRCLMARLGLTYAAIDLRETLDGELVLLEVNPQGQFLYIEILTGYPLAASMARELARTV